MNNKNIIFNMTIEQYNKRYRNRKGHLLKFSKKDVSNFGDKNNVDNKFFLNGRKWALIGDTYYEIPKFPRITWFRNLNACVQASVCLLGAGIVATAVTVPLCILNRDSHKINEEQWTKAINNIIDYNIARNVSAKKEASHYSKIVSGIGDLKQTSEENSSIVGLIKITDSNENEKSTYGSKIKLIDEKGIETEKEYSYIADTYQKKSEGKIFEKIIWDKYEPVWEEIEIDDLISVQFKLKKVLNDFKDFIYKDSAYTHSYTEEIKQDGKTAKSIIEYKLNFENSKLISLGINREVETHLSLPTGAYRDQTGSYKFKYSFFDYGTTSFEMPE